jgi:hypothetical protein
MLEPARLALAEGHDAPMNSSGEPAECSALSFEPLVRPMLK